MCLDVMRAIAREPEAANALLDELADAGSADAALAREIIALRSLLGTPPEQLEGMGRLLAQRLVLATQAALLRKAAPSAVADAFIATRLGEAAWGRVVGAFDGRGVDIEALLERALPA
jgi:putative acyl-CoA dehydrogenase